MAENKFKEKSQKEILAMTKDAQEKYWEDFTKYVQEKKREFSKKKKEQEKILAEQKRKRLNHARFIAFGAILNLPNAKELMREISKNEFTQQDLDDLNLLMNSLDWSAEVKFENLKKEAKNEPQTQNVESEKRQENIKEEK